MKPRMALKIIVDIAMTVALMLLMTYELIGRAAHEWIYVCPVPASPCPEQQVEQEYPERKVHFPAPFTDNPGGRCASVHDGFHDQRYCLVRACLCVPYHPQRTELGKNMASALLLLGVCDDEPAPWVPLEHDDGHGQKAFWRVRPNADMDTPGSCCRHCSLWSFCL